MNEPDWLTKARAEGRVKETAVRPESLISSLAKRQDFMEGVLAGASEEEFQRHVIELAQANGWKVAHFRKVRVQRADGSVYWETPVAADGKGFPDLLMVKGGRLLVAELKVGRNKLEHEQAQWMAAFTEVLAARDIEVALWYPKDWRDIVKAITNFEPPEAASVPQELHRLADDGNPHAADD